jgi:hypothetical protein
MKWACQQTSFANDVRHYLPGHKHNGKLPAGLPGMKPGNDKEIHLIRQYLEKPSLRGTFARARKAWRDAIRNNRW